MRCERERDLTPCVVMFRIVDDARPPLPENCSGLLRDFLLKCFQKDPSQRPSAEILFEHPWLKLSWGVHKVILIIYLITSNPANHYVNC
jgi:serine/threonine protein kinase